MSDKTAKNLFFFFLVDAGHAMQLRPGLGLGLQHVLYMENERRSARHL